MTRSRIPHRISYTSFSTEFGTVYAAVTDRGVCRVTYETTEEDFEEDMKARYGCGVGRDSDHPRLRDVEGQIERYLLGELRRFDLAVDFLEGTPFHRRVWRTLRTIPYGQVRSYKWVAEQVGIPAGARAVGQANRRNRISFIIPCHRVINHDGRLGGFGDRIDVKEYLLRLEGAAWGRGNTNRSAGRY